MPHVKKVLQGPSVTSLETYSALTFCSVLFLEWASSSRLPCSRIIPWFRATGRGVAWACFRFSFICPGMVPGFNALRHGIRARWCFLFILLPARLLNQLHYRAEEVRVQAEHRGELVEGFEPTRLSHPAAAGSLLTVEPLFKRGLLRVDVPSFSTQRRGRCAFALASVLGVDPTDLESEPCLCLLQPGKGPPLRSPLCCLRLGPLRTHTGRVLGAHLIPARPTAFVRHEADLDKPGTHRSD